MPINKSCWWESETFVFWGFFLLYDIKSYNLEFLTYEIEVYSLKIIKHQELTGLDRDLRPPRTKEKG